MPNVNVAAFQAPLAGHSIRESVHLIRERVLDCEAFGVSVLCCPEGILGGLADYVQDPAAIALDVRRGQLAETLAPLASDTVTTIVGFTERDGAGRIYNSAAVYHRGEVFGIYRKLHPAIRRSVYSAGDAMPVFAVGRLTFGIVICYDSTFVEPARVLAGKGATVLFIPTNNGLPPGKGGEELVAEARKCDVALAVLNEMTVVRADVAGQHGSLTSYGASAIVSPTGLVIASARRLEPDLLVAEIPTTPGPIQLPDRPDLDHPRAGDHAAGEWGRPADAGPKPR
jgi:predicted amidohydrolase